MKKILLSTALFVFVMNFFAVTHTVNSGSYYYLPATLTVNVNDTVVWVNDGGYHNVNFDINTITGMSFNNPVSFISSPTNGTAIHTYVFTVPGTYNYDCSVGSHASSGMVGTVQVNAVSNPLVGTWKLAQIPAALAVGPNQGDGSWWSSSAGDVNTRSCLFDDSISFDLNGNFMHYMDGNTWVEAWQDGSGDGCRAPVTPHSGGSFTYTYTNGVLTVNGLGAHLGLPKVTNNGEITSPSNAATSVSYTISLDTIANTLTADIDFGGGWWRYVYQKTSLPQPTSFNIVFSVNTANITVGPNGMYAGGGILGDAMAIPLFDSNNDGIWAGVATNVPASGGNYVFLNSPANGGDWGAKEDLTGLPCGDPNNWNDRLLPALTVDTMLQHCFGSCETDGTCPGPPPSGNPVNITYNVDINDYLAGGATLASNGIRIAGNFGANGALSSGFTMPDWNPTDTACAMSDPDGDNIWSITISYGSLPVGTQQFYKFVNGNWGGDESVNDPLCGGAGGFGSDRFLVLPSNDSVVCYKWATCTSCGNSTTGNDLALQGIIDFTVPAGGSSGKAIHLRVNNNISDLSVYGIGVANNGGGTDSVEYAFPSISVTAGDEILLARDTTEMAMYFDSCFSNFHHVLLATNSISQNGDDAIELFHNGTVIETFGDINVDGSGEPWEYMDSWAYKLGPTVGTPGPTSFSGFDWSFGVVNCTDGSTTTQSSSCPYPFCSGGNPPPPASTYDVTLKVNTATIYQNGGMVGPNGMYAGGGFLGGANGLLLVQSTTDSLLWTGVATVVSGSGPNYYAFFNSPNSGSDWGTKENLNGLPCGDPANYNDRLLPNIMSDTTIQHCFGSCETDGSCPPPPSSFVDVTFTLNVSSITSTGGTIDPTGMFIAGGGTFGNPGDNPMTDLGGGVWSFTVTKPIGFTSDYTFTNGNSGWGAKENISGLPCAVPPYDDRNLAPVYSDTTIQHCFGTCDYDGTCNSVVTPPTGTNVTFQVDMSEVTDPFTAAELNGTFNGWCGNCDAMSDVDGDSVWDVTVSLTPGDTVEYKYSADSWAIQEMNDPGAPCTNGDSTYTNRVLVIPASDTILGVVCWASCDPCVVVPPTGISDWIDNVKIYPNPANNILNISSSEIIQKVEVLDVVGRVIISKTLNSSNYILDVSNLNRNVYFVNYSINGVVNTKKVIVNN